MPTYDATQAFRRAFAKLDARTAAAFMAAVAVFVGEPAERGLAPPFHPSLRVHKLTGLDLWSLSHRRRACSATDQPTTTRSGARYMPVFRSLSSTLRRAYAAD